MTDELKKEIISHLSEYGQQGCSVNELFRNLQCSKNDFVDVKNQLIKQRVIGTKKEGKQKIILYLNSGFFSGLDTSFHNILKSYEMTADDALKRLRKLKPLFEHTDDKNELSGVKVTNQNVTGLFHVITGVLEAISHYTMVFTLRYHIDPQAKKFDLKENQKDGFETMQKIIEKLIAQHKNEEKEIRKYLLWGTTSSFSYVF
ncbi:MAG TPA: hypothetical protein VEU72_07470 [Nitrosopumilaceae archaeon]|nr:hypothetical protein [Nitrosopumilaceae archaeon]